MSLTTVIRRRIGNYSLVAGNGDYSRRATIVASVDEAGLWEEALEAYKR